MMFDADVYVKRRAVLKERVGTGLILLLGNGDAPRNFRDNTYHFRQDSSFLYYFGLNHAGFDGILDCDSGEEILFADDLTIDDYVWTGVQPSSRELALSSGIRRSAPSDELDTWIGLAQGAGRRVHYLPPYRDANRLKLARLLGFDPVGQGFEPSRALIEGVADQRNHKEEREIGEISRAVDISVDMHVAAMKLCRPGLTEARVAAEVEKTARAAGGDISFCPLPR